MARQAHLAPPPTRANTRIPQPHAIAHAPTNSENRAYHIPGAENPTTANTDTDADADVLHGV
ncbi:hypothetical protein BGAL_0116g00310 [Botrytis galanthina]|uniref:Uncharacterized protein n=1 Tax=Botrytis galanthina TaxID=278940 RepID=A0A4S8RAF4_9HELO|nr:hypothetical protein BGAL_0116g00310 [Botrytis galanthina]